ncbi:MAG: hypothetical protein A3F72_11615 [Bacteroidetes bacterium RIFCSPLOWO2_12_FULL_35_15]|nr:MAG: hypothetical protein A3F72_11615 [Bacteroidetes bacterium RIFCSPLOWO2_12_FULL_35_15]
METFSFLASSEDLKNRTFQDWLSAHYSFGSPLHRYDGELILSKDQLHYIGIDTKNNNSEFSAIIYKYQIEQIYLGFDDVFTVSESRSLGLKWKPIRIKIVKNGIEENLYFITYLENGFNTEEWFNILISWLS